MNRFLLTLLPKDHPENAHLSFGDVLYRGDNYQDAKRIAEETASLPENKGRTMRFVDYLMFGGGMKSIVIN